MQILPHILYSYYWLLFISGALDSVKLGRHIWSTYYVPGTTLGNKLRKMRVTPSLCIQNSWPSGEDRYI